jgi:hypothetical protein
MTVAGRCYSACYSDLLRSVGHLANPLVRWVGLSGLEPLTSALSERFWPVAAQRSQDRIARPERCEASRGLASLWCAFEARESRSPLRQRPLSRSSDARSPGASPRPSRSTPRWANGSGRLGTEGNETTTETRGDLCLIRDARPPGRRRATRLRTSGTVPVSARVGEVVLLTLVRRHRSSPTANLDAHGAGRRRDLSRDRPLYEAGRMLLFRRKKLSGS